MEISDFKLRDFEDSDFPFMYQLVVDFLKTDLSVTQLDVMEYKEFVKKFSNDDSKRYVITNDLDERLGFVHLLKNNEVGFFLKPEYQGKGIASRAVKMLMELHPRERYFATINNNNEPSKNLVKKLGFYPKGTIYEKIPE